MFKLVKVRAPSFLGSGRRYGYYTRQEKVPRCDMCKSYHEKRAKWTENFLVKGIIAAAIAGGLAGILFALYAVANLTKNWGFQSKYLFLFIMFAVVGGMCGLIIGGIIMAIIMPIMRPRLPKGIRGSSFAKKFPTVQSALKQGWKLGEEPRKEYKAVYMGRITGTEEIPNDR